MLGLTFSHYRIIEKLGSGGMGVVYKAEITRLHRFVTLKFLPEDLVRDPQALARFQREAQAASALNHSNICTIHDVGEQDGRAFIAMELLEGVTLQNRVAGKPLPLELCLEWAIQISDALEAAHAKGIAHSTCNLMKRRLTLKKHSKSSQRSEPTFEADESARSSTARCERSTRGSSGKVDGKTDLPAVARSGPIRGWCRERKTRGTVNPG